LQIFVHFCPVFYFDAGDHKNFPSYGDVHGSDAVEAILFVGGEINFRPHFPHLLCDLGKVQLKGSE